MPSLPPLPLRSQSLVLGKDQATIRLVNDAPCRTYELSSTQPLRDDNPPDGRITFSEKSGNPSTRSGNLLFDGLYAMAIAEALQNSVSEVSDSAYNGGGPIAIEAYQTGEKWTYVWTRDLAYSLFLGLGGFDPSRAVNSLRFKSSVLKASVRGGLSAQMIQDTGSGGSYPISTDRVTWALGAQETLKYLSGKERETFLGEVYQIFCGTIEQDRKLIFDPEDGLYRGEHSFLDWREQSYPGRTRNQILPIALSKALSVNASTYFLLKTAAEYSVILQRPDLQEKYSAWAGELKAAINRHFYDQGAGLYRTYLFSEDGSRCLPSSRYDLLGEALVILFGVADPVQAQIVIESYPVGPFGPPVLWPQEQSVDIYHNQGIWPFVTAFWLKAAKATRNTEAVEAGVESLYRQAALNLSNMENFDFRSGQPFAVDGSRSGPVINSRRQLWSVAAYFSMVQDILFGLETSWEGIRFQPFFTAGLHARLFPKTAILELRDFSFRGTLHQARIHMPTLVSDRKGAYEILRIDLNGSPSDGGFVGISTLSDKNTWDIFLGAVQGDDRGRVRRVEVKNEPALFAPLQPEWSGDGIRLEKGKLTLRFSHPDLNRVSFNIFREGKYCARGLRETAWTDPDSGDWERVVRSYAVEAVDLECGLVSHASSFLSYRIPDQEEIIPAAAMQNSGKLRAEKGIFLRWGHPDEVLTTLHFRVRKTGRYRIRAEFSNGSGTLQTGLTCAVKRLELQNESAEAIGSSYLVMPQSNDWNRWDLSSGLVENFEAGKNYRLVLGEDEYCRNMSYFKNNESYTVHAGGGTESFNRINLKALRLFYLSV